MFYKVGPAGFEPATWRIKVFIQPGYKKLFERQHSVRFSQLRWDDKPDKRIPSLAECVSLKRKGGSSITVWFVLRRLSILGYWGNIWLAFGFTLELLADFDKMAGI